MTRKETWVRTRRNPRFMGLGQENQKYDKTQREASAHTKYDWEIKIQWILENSLRWRENLDEIQRAESLPPAKKEIKYIVDHLPMRKAPRPDYLTAELLKYGGRVTLEMTVKLMTLMWNKQTVPKGMWKANIFLIPKDKRDPKNPMQQRPILLTKIWTKVLDKLLYTRL